MCEEEKERETDRHKAEKDRETIPSRSDNKVAPNSSLSSCSLPEASTRQSVTVRRSEKATDSKSILTHTIYHHDHFATL